MFSTKRIRRKNYFSHKSVNSCVQVELDYLKLSKCLLMKFYITSCRYSEKKLDVIAIGMSEITFIHGNGRGILKSKFQKQLSQHPHVAFYQGAQKNKFGYGATYAKIVSKK